MNDNFDISIWLNLITEKIINRFPERVLFIGHVGSYARGEAGPESDIDINVILDEVKINDLISYKEIVKEMPFSDKACGFISGKDEILSWPRHELFHFLYGCKVLYGSIEEFLEEPNKQEIIDYIRISSSGILHFARHTFIYSKNIGNSVDQLKDCYKNSFFILQAYMKITQDQLINNKNDMADYLTEELSLSVLKISVNWNKLGDDRQLKSEYYFNLLIEWSSKLLLSLDCIKN
jgi:uncharacterized protein